MVAVLWGLSCLRKSVRWKHMTWTWGYQTPKAALNTLIECLYDMAGIWTHSFRSDSRHLHCCAISRVGILHRKQLYFKQFLYFNFCLHAHTLLVHTHTMRACFAVPTTTRTFHQSRIWVNLVEVWAHSPKIYKMTLHYYAIPAGYIKYNKAYWKS